VQIQHIVNRSAASSAAAIAFIGAGQAVSSIDALASADITLISTPDDQIAACAHRLALSSRFKAHSMVFHCSGAHTAEQLDAVRQHGAAVASVHPIRSFAQAAVVADNFSATWCGVEGDAIALAILEPLFKTIGAQFVVLKSEHKTLYHAAAVFACNYLVTLQDVALAAYAQAGIAPEIGLQLLAPLVRETVDNVMRMGPAAALTGPIARGDVDTVARQQQAVMEWRADYGRLYEQLAEVTTALAAREK
jgi:predicted short-subunit dehydrogenase-like oxidoreductase (DUF2520 family)